MTVKKMVKMTKKEITLALTVLCPQCGRMPNKRCKNTKTGEMKSIPHQARLELAKNPPKPMQAIQAPVQFKPDPKAKLTAEQKEVVDIVNEKVHALGARADFIGPVSVGPVISTYRFFPKGATRVSALENMAKDFAAALGAEAVLVKRMPGETAVGVFVPNKERKLINFRDTVEHVMEYWNRPTKDKHVPIPINFGEDQLGHSYIDDLTEMPHLLVAGSTGSGKSTLLHCIVASLVFAVPNSKLKLCISDTKGVEFVQFNELPHLLFGPGTIATDVYKTMAQMQALVDETKIRQQRIAHRGVRNVHEYNQLVPDHEKLPYIVLVIDELADLMGTAVDAGEAKLNSAKLQTIVQRSRFTGIYVIAGTQRPDVKTVGGAIKSNFPCRVSFRLPSQIDSRTVLNTKGAENLLKQGDMLYYSNSSSELKRLHAPYTSLEDVMYCLAYVTHRDSKQQVPEANQTGVSSRVQ